MQELKVSEELLSYATPAGVEYIKAVLEHGGQREAARALGVNQSVISRTIARAKRNAAQHLHSPEHGLPTGLAPGHISRGYSQLVDAEGKVRMTWLKGRADPSAQMELLRETAAAFAEELPRTDPTPPPAAYDADLCNVYTLTDSHVGMLAWHKEGGADWDVKIAERTLVGCFEAVVEASPSADTCVIAQLGDFLHSDSMQPVTPTSGHVLDQDGRYSRIVSAAIRILRRTIHVALQRHRRVVVLLAEGNHDIVSSIWLRCMFRALYEHEPRVHVIDSELPYYVHEHGRTMLAWHHGHLKKNDQLPLMFAAQFPRSWGATTKRYCHVGHRHHVETKEHSGMTVVQHGTLAARDAYAARGGWIAERQITAYTYHATHGQLRSTTVTPEMVASAAVES